MALAKKQASRKRTANKSKSTFNKNKEIIKDIILVFAIALSLVMAISIYTKSAGIFGNFIGRLLIGLLGIGAYILPFIILITCLYILFAKENELKKPTIILISIVYTNIITFFHLISGTSRELRDLKSFYVNAAATNGGFIGALIGNILNQLVGIYVTFILIIAITLVVLILLTGKSLLEAIKQINFDWIKIDHNYDDDCQGNEKKAPVVKNSTPSISKEHQADINKDTYNSKIKKEEPLHIFGLEDSQNTNNFKYLNKQTVSENPASIAKTRLYNNINSQNGNPEYKFPPLDLLQKSATIQSKESKEQLMKNKGKLEETLASFGVVAKVIQINTGPTVTRYEISPKQGVKVSKIVNLADDIALNLAASGIRIEAPIPGKAAVGIEIPNKEHQTVFLRDVLEDEEFLNYPSNLAFGLGKDITGNAVVTDIAKMPHLLIAGATGAGKSVCINTLIASILYKATPNDVKLIMIDPKVVELSIYNGIPHLMLPVVTDPKEAAGALNWAVNQMTKRYKQFAKTNVRDIKGYNAYKKKSGEIDTLPQIVIIIDELADLMMAAPHEVEDSICRLAQMARAAGIHLIIATQRPSVDIITGVIKANIPSRLAFSVSSGIDSRTILDTVGAEKLLGRGDMLFNPIGAAKPLRIQGAFIEDKEVENIVEFIKQHHTVEYDAEIIKKITTATKEDDELEKIIDDVAEFAVENEKISIAQIKNHFDINAKRATRVMEELEKRGIISQGEGSKSRKVLITPFELEMKRRNKK